MYSADRHGHWDEEAFKDIKLRAPGMAISPLFLAVGLPLFLSVQDGRRRRRRATLL